MKKSMLAMFCIITIIMICPIPTSAGLTSVMCQDEYQEKDQKLCQGLLIGTIDSLQGLGIYCPDGHTSYGHIINAWRRLLSKKPQLKELPTVITVRMAIDELDLLCGR